jgi:hypothetical protein
VSPFWRGFIAAGMLCAFFMPAATLFLLKLWMSLDTLHVCPGHEDPEHLVEMNMATEAGRLAATRIAAEEIPPGPARDAILIMIDAQIAKGTVGR